MPNDLHYRISLLYDSIIPESQNTKACGLQRFTSSLVPLDLFSMLPTVDFYNEPFFDTHEIQDEIAKRVLAAKLQSMHLLSAQMLP